MSTFRFQALLPTSSEESSFDKPTYTLAPLAADMAALIRFAANLIAIYFGRRVPPGRREEIFAAVSRVNGCRYCSYLHRNWAAAVGVAPDELARLMDFDGTCDTADRADFVAIAYAQALSESDFGTIDAQLAADVQLHLSPGERRDIEALARAITMMNRAANTVDAFVLKLEDREAPSRQWLEEGVVAFGMLVGMSAVVPLWAVLARRNPIDIVRDFVTFSRSFENESAAKTASINGPAPHF